MASPPEFRRIVDLHSQGRLRPAEAALRAWIAAHPDHAEAHARLGMILQARGLPVDALPHLRIAASLAPDDPRVACLVGAASHALGLLDEAAASYRRAIAIAPRLERAYNNLGLVLREQGDPVAAEAVFRAVLDFMPDYATALGNLGALLVARGRDGEARAPLLRALRLRPDDKETLLQLAGCLERSGELDEAIRLLQAASGRAGTGRAPRMALARMLAATNQAAQARVVYAQVLADHPGDLKAALGACLTLPQVYASHAELVTERRRFEQGLATLESAYGAASGPRMKAACLLAELAWVNFPLAYQGLDDRTLQMRYGQWLTRLLQQALPGWMADRSPRARAGAPVRIGFVSSLFHRSTVCGYFSSWITGLDPARFEVFVYHAGVREDEATRVLAAACAHYLHLPLRDGAAMHALAQRIAADAPDILVYPELGMTAELFPLAALRLAPVQCAGWGHPVTTGLPNVDHYFTSGPMECRDAQSHYSERLVALPGLGTRYVRPAIPAGSTREEFGLPPERHLVLFPHAPFKIHPDNDALLAEIAARDGAVLFVLVQDRIPALTGALLARLASAFAARGCELGRHVIVLPYQLHDAYLRLNGLCDLMLDCLHWSGGNTTLDALACGLPVVSLPGTSMRSRQSAAMLCMAGLEALVAADESAYVATALRLLQDTAWAAAICARLQDGAAAVFDQAAPVQSFQCMVNDIIGYANGMQR